METEELEKKKPSLSAKKIDRQNRIWELRKRGASFRAIAATLKKQDIAEGGTGRGFSHEQIRQDFKVVLEQKLDEQDDLVTEVRTITAERLDDLYMRISPLLDNPKPKTKIAAANTLIRANREYAELHGAKRPQKIEHSGRVDTAVVLELGKLSTEELLQLNALNEKLNAS